MAASAKPKQAAVRRQVSGSRSVKEANAPLPPQSEIKMSVVDVISRLRLDDQRFVDYVREGKWRDRQQHGRLMYDKMYGHPGVKAPLEILLAIIKSLPAGFDPANADASDLEVQMAEFLDDQKDRLSLLECGGWTGMVDGLFGQALEFGFALCEVGTDYVNWNGRPMVQLTDFAILPQASLDHGFVPLENTGTRYAGVDPRYNCFDLSPSGRIERVYQYRKSSTSRLYQMPYANNEIVWEGDDLQRILHFKHKGGDGNPFGESILYSAFEPWSDLYIRERIEQQFLDVSSTPFLTAERTADSPSPAASDDIKKAVKERDFVFNVLIGTNTKFGKVTASDDAYTTHIKQIKDELKQYIAQAMLVPMPIFVESKANEQNFRDMLSVFLKFRIREILNEIEEFMTFKFGARLIRANYNNVEPGQYPRFRFRVTLDQELKDAIPLVMALMPHIDSRRLGEAMHAIAPVIRPEFISKEHKDSVGVQRPAPKPEIDSKAMPPNQKGEKTGKQEAA